MLQHLCFTSKISARWYLLRMYNLRQQKIPNNDSENSETKKRAKAVRTEASRVTQSDYGVYKMWHRIHVDQIPFEIDQTARKTFVAAETSDLAIVAGIPGGDKRFGTLQVAMHGDPDFVQPRVGYPLDILSPRNNLIKNVLHV